MKKLTFICAIASIAFMASCTKNEGETPIPQPGTDKLPIKISTQLSTTRATDTAFEAGDQIGIYVVNQIDNISGTLTMNGNHVDNMRFTYGENEWTPDTEIYWVDKDTKADFYCYHPYNSNISSIEEYSFAVKENQSDVENYKKSDFLWGRTMAATPSEEEVDITLNHIMSNVIIKLIAGNGYTSNDMDAASVTICGLKSNATINLATGSVTATGDIKEIIPMKENGQHCALVVPQNVTNTDLIKVTIADKVYVLNQSVDFKSGKQHTCTLTIERTNQGINIGIGGWESGGDDFGGIVE